VIDDSSQDWTYFCNECGHEQAEGDSCDVCGSDDWEFVRLDEAGRLRQKATRARESAVEASQEAGDSDFVDKLERLARLLEAGALTPSEFQEAKAKVIAAKAAPAQRPVPRRIRDTAREEVIASGMRAMTCPHCQTKGTVTTTLVRRKKGVSGAKATGAVLTGGLSILGTGLSRKELETEAHCSACGATWHYS
jgi:hypothetical protein